MTTTYVNGPRNTGISLQHNRELLVVDDERSIRDACASLAEKAGFHAVTAANASDALATMSECPADVILTDLRMPGKNGIEFLDEIRKRFPETLVIIMTGYSSVESAVDAMKHGAFDYICKPFHLDELEFLLKRVELHFRTIAENLPLRADFDASGTFSQMIGRSAEMQKLFRVASRAASSNYPVLITGETGSGKELLARSIHKCGEHCDRPFVPVDCGSIAPSLLDGELFGTSKGADGSPRAGLLTTIEGGTIFLNEIAEMPLDLQAKLFRAIQEQEVWPVGGTRSTPLRARVIAATSSDLEARVREARFRQDLFYRLSVLVVRVPPLRNRPDDIPLLVAHFLGEMERETGARNQFAPEALRLLKSYAWPGNVRELQNCVVRACVMRPGATIQIGDLPEELQVPAAEPQQAVEGPPLTLAEVEKQAILDAMVRSRGDKSRAAEMLGIGRTTLYRKLHEYGF